MTPPGTAWFAQPDLPRDELKYFRSQIRESAHLLDHNNVISAYAAAGLDVVPDPFDPTLARQIKKALQTNTPYSHIRIGDAEVSMLAYGGDPETPGLDRLALEKSVMLYQDRFRLCDAWATRLKSLMHSAVKATDAIGVVGMWRSRKLESTYILQYLLENIEGDARGLSGHWRAIRHMLKMGEAGEFDGKLVCSAHSYFGLVKSLGAIIEAAAHTTCITNRPAAVAELRSRYAGKIIHHIELPSEFTPIEQLPNEPDFLDRVKSQIPDDMTGQLVLVGAGSWAEFYCTWIKERGGVAVDIGSGFDLLQGAVTRPVHKWYLEARGLSLEDFFSSDQRQANSGES